MNAIFKRLLFVIAFVLLTLFLPSIILLMFFDASTSFSVYVIVYGIVIFGIWGYVISSIRNVEKKIDETMNEIKMQNAAIAYKLTNADNQVVPATVQEPKIDAVVKENAINTNNIPLNPPDPLVMPEENKVATKTVDDGFDDFK